MDDVLSSLHNHIVSIEKDNRFYAASSSVFFCYLYLISLIFICFSRNTWFTRWIVMMGATFSVGISHEILWKWLTSSRCEIKLTSCWASCVLWCISHQKSYTTLVCRSVHFCVVNIKQRWQKSFMSIDFAKILPKNWNSLRLNWC